MCRLQRHITSPHFGDFHLSSSFKKFSIPCFSNRRRISIVRILNHIQSIAGFLSCASFSNPAHGKLLHSRQKPELFVLNCFAVMKKTHLLSLIKSALQAFYILHQMMHIQKFMQQRIEEHTKPMS